MRCEAGTSGTVELHTSKANAAGHALVAPQPLTGICACAQLLGLFLHQLLVLNLQQADTRHRETDDNLTTGQQCSARQASMAAEKAVNEARAEAIRLLTHTPPHCS